MSPSEFEKTMEEIMQNKDIAERHIEADMLMCNLLETLGYREGVMIFHQKAKWYE